MGRGLLIIISGPSGSGKGTVVKRLCSSGGFDVSISVTSRGMRDGEVEARDYFFRSKSQFRDMLERGELLESAMFCGNYYGTPRSYVESRIAEGGTVVLEIEVNGALQVKEQLSDSVLVFLMPPTFAELKRRLVSRNTEDMETVEDRLRRAREEISLIGKYDYLVINEDVDGAVADIVSIVRAEKLRPERSAPDGWDIP